MPAFWLFGQSGNISTQKREEGGRESEQLFTFHVLAITDYTDTLREFEIENL